MNCTPRFTNRSCGPKYEDPIQVVIAGYFHSDVHAASSDADMAILEFADYYLLKPEKKEKKEKKEKIEKKEEKKESKKKKTKEEKKEG